MNARSRREPTARLCEATGASYAQRLSNAKHAGSTSATCLWLLQQPHGGGCAAAALHVRPLRLGLDVRHQHQREQRQPALTRRQPEPRQCAASAAKACAQASAGTQAVHSAKKRRAVEALPDRRVGCTQAVVLLREHAGQRGAAWRRAPERRTSSSISAAKASSSWSSSRCSPGLRCASTCAAPGE